MAKTVSDAMLDAALNYVKNNGTEITVCSTQPTTYTEAHTTYMLANHTMAPADYTVGNGDTNGRKVAVAQQADITVTNTGSAQHVAITNTAGSLLILVTTCTTQSLTAENLVTIPTFDDEIADPT